MFPPRLRDRTVSPNTWPMVFTTRVPGMFSVVVTIMLCGEAIFSPGACTGLSLPPELSDIAMISLFLPQGEPDAPVAAHHDPPEIVPEYHAFLAQQPGWQAR